jgi:hypothetical protein
VFQLKRAPIGLKGTFGIFPMRLYRTLGPGERKRNENHEARVTNLLVARNGDRV